jgi:predicted AAA+ superfamily ATPase
MERRHPYLKIWETLAAEKSMVFLAGPRQSGKTTLAKIIADVFTNSLYCNWDIPEHRARLLKNPVFFTSLFRRDASRPLVVFDEIHKYRDWKNYLKGMYNQFSGDYQFLVAGSGRLDLFQKGGDSLAGRYLLFHLWPFTAAELGGGNRTLEDLLHDPLQVSLEQVKEAQTIWEGLETLSGFPEPFFSGRVTSYRRWTTGYSQRLIREDIRELTDIRSVTDMETLYHLLPSKVGSPLSVPSLANDLRVTYNTMRNWLAVFERFFLTFSLSTWTERIARAIHKERKIYLFDTPRIKNPAARFENMVAIELWRAVSCWNAMGYGFFTLHFIRNKAQQEVDFLIANEREPFLLIECKLADGQPAKPLLAMQQSLRVPAIQLVRSAPGYRTYRNGDLSVLVVPAAPWCRSLPT